MKVTVAKAFNGVLKLWARAAFGSFLALAASAPAQSEGAAGSDLIIVGAHVIDGTGKEPLRNTAVYISNGVIDRIDEISDGRYLSGANVFSAHGKFLIPGLVDAHTHIDSIGGIALDDKQKVIAREYYPRAFLFNGVTTVINLSAHVPDDVLALRDSVKENPTVLLPRIFTGAANFTVNGGWSGRHGGGITSISEIETRLEQYAERGFDLVKIINEDGLGHEAVFTVIPQKYMKAIARASRKHDLPVFVHATDETEFKRSIAIEPRGIVHGLFTPQKENSALIRSLRDKGIFVVPTISLFEAFVRVRDNPDVLSDPLLIASVPDFIFEKASDKAVMQASYDKMDEILRMDSGDWARSSLAALKENTRKMVEAGVPVAVGTDSGGAVVHAFQGYNTPRELEILAECCMTEMQTIVAATKIGADMIGGGEKFGTLQPGKAADILVLDGNPLEDIAYVRKFEHLVLRGKLIDRSSLTYDAYKREKETQAKAD